MNPLVAKRLILLSTVFTSVLVFLFLPSEILLRNPREFISTVPELLGSLAPVALFTGLALVLPVLVPNTRWRRWYAAATAAAFLSLWASGVFLVADLGELDGSSFDLSRHTAILAWQVAIFILVYSAACFATMRKARLVTAVVGTLGLGLTLIAAVNFYRVWSDDEDVWLPVDIADITRFSTDRNVLIVLMDSFQSDVLRGLMRQEPELRDQLDGFRFYPDTLGVAPSTYLTMPAMHSGVSYNNMMSLLEYYDVGVRDGSFMAELASNGYEVDSINPIVGICPEGVDTCTRQENLLLHAGEISGNEASRLADLGILRVAPGLMKHLVFNGTSGPVTRLRDDIGLTGLEMRIYQSNSLLRMIADNIRATEGPPTARLLHLLNTHPPFMFDAECRFIGVQKAIDRDHMTQQTACAMRWFVYLLDQLKAQGVYDNTMIVLGADTGAGNVWGDDDQSSLYALEHGVPPGELGRLIGGANPVLAIKLPHERGSARVYPLQAQLTDIPRTVCEAGHECNVSDGIDLAATGAVERERIYHYYRWRSDYWGMKRIPGMIEYRVNGPLWLESSWSRGFSSEIPREISNVEFSHADQPEIFGMGWGQVEVNEQGISKRWSTARRAELFLPLPADVELALEFQVLAAPEVIDQVMTIRVNGTSVGSRRVENRVQFVSATVPPGLVHEPLTKIDLEFSGLQQSEKSGKRKISVSFYQLKILQPPAEEPSAESGG